MKEFKEANIIYFVYAIMITIVAALKHYGQRQLQLT